MASRYVGIGHATRLIQPSIGIDPIICPDHGCFAAESFISAAGEDPTDSMILLR